MTDIAYDFTVSQVAWQFVVQYYTYMNDKPDQLHRFYTKNSHYLHGVEGEETLLLQGQTAIHKKFLEIEFKECKVFIHSVDAHPSANNGIMVHVIGEMSNNSEPWKKFVQAFFLAEQQNGYFVLNDNFRYLKEESFGEDEEEGEEGQQAETNAAPAVGQQSASTQDQSQPTYSHTNGYHHSVVTNDITPSQSLPPSATISAPLPAPAVAPPAPPAPVPAPPTPAEPAPEPMRLPTPSPEPTPTPSVPEVVEPAHEEPAAPTPSMPSPASASRKTPSPAPPSPAAAIAEPTQPAPPVSKPTTQQPPTPAAPSAPPAPKTWASLAATNSSRWGQNVAQEAKGVSAAAPQQPHAPNPAAAHLPRERPAGGPSPAAVNTAADPAMQPGGVGPRNIPPAQQHPAYAATLAITTPLCFIKGVTENIPQQVLEQVLTQRFGPIKECEVVRSKACAFLEFRSVDSAKRAIIASLHGGAGGEGGIHLDEQKYGSPARINVETRKERGDRPAPRPRGGMIAGGDGRGTMGPGGPNSPGGPGGFQTAGRGGRGGGGGMRGRGDGVRGAKP
jgi:Nuclear transport factor 2 (NTF2) domain/RNA recognition motif. (a.k.a. RRM, RBD, or RNP domain)